jgi:phosphohistidine phosphatase
MGDHKRLFVLRHAKSSWDDPGLDDQERPLAPRGRRAVKLLNQHLRENDIAPQLVLCSSSRRTRETLEGLDLGGEASIESELYAASAQDVLERLRRVPVETGSVMVIGHNPAMQKLVLRLAVDRGRLPDDSELAAIRQKFPTGALAVLTFDCGWDELSPGRAVVAGYVRPKAIARQ